MYRRRYLVAAGSALLLAGCSDGEAEETPTETNTPTETSTPTATATESLETEDDVEIETETETDTETETPSDAELAQNHLQESRALVSQAHEAYLDQGPTAETLVDVGPGTMNFRASPVVELCNQAEDALDEAADVGVEDLETQIGYLRTSIQWLAFVAELQERLSVVASEFDAAAEAAGERYNFDATVSEFEDAVDAIDAAGSIRAQDQSLSAPAFREIDGVDADEMSEKNTQINRQTLALESRLRDDILATASATEQLTDAQLDNEAGAYEDARQTARDSRDRLESAIDAFEGESTTNFEDIGGLFVDAADRVVDSADRIIAVANRGMEDSESG